MSTTPVSDKLGVPVISGMAFLTGMGKEEVLQEIIDKLKEE